jgi:hypothetical protein
LISLMLTGAGAGAGAGAGDGAGAGAGAGASLPPPHATRPNESVTAAAKLKWSRKDFDITVLSPYVALVDRYVYGQIGRPT